MIVIPLALSLALFGVAPAAVSDPTPRSGVSVEVSIEPRSESPAACNPCGGWSLPQTGQDAAGLAVAGAVGAAAVVTGAALIVRRRRHEPRPTDAVASRTR